MRNNESEEQSINNSSQQTGASPSTILRKRSGLCSYASPRDYPREYNTWYIRKNQEKTGQHTSKVTWKQPIATKCPGSKTTSTQEHTTNTGVVLRKKPLTTARKRTQESKEDYMESTESLEDRMQEMLGSKPLNLKEKRSRPSTTYEAEESDSEILTQKPVFNLASFMRQRHSYQPTLAIGETSKSSPSSVQQVLANPTQPTKSEEKKSSPINEMAGLVVQTLKEMCFSSMNSQVTCHYQSSSSFSMDIQISCQSKDPSTQQDTQRSSLPQM